MSLNGLSRYDLRQLVAEGILTDDSNDPAPMCVHKRIAGPLDKLQKVEQVRSLDLILCGSFLRADTSEGQRPSPNQQRDGKCQQRANPLRPTLARREFLVVVKSHPPRNVSRECP